jgi:hypothetical protein
MPLGVALAGVVLRLRGRTGRQKVCGVETGLARWDDVYFFD